MKKIFVIIVCVFSFIGIVYAAEQIIGKNILFDNSVTDLTATNVQDAVDELYKKADALKGYSCNGNVTEPVLTKSLIPVTISDDGTVTYADITKSWYDYCRKIWANAVILEDNTSYKVGDTIKEEDIQSYFVWIPKYKYKLWNVDTASKKVHEIDIVFDTTDTTDVEGVSCKTPMVSGESGNCTNGEYMTHPAFISMGVNGFWVGKYETGYKGATTTATAQVSSNDSSKIIIKPNVYSWRSITVLNAFTASYNYKREMDSHMMKNTEWGAVSYLSHSKYGINREININNNSSFITGSSALPSTNQQTYKGGSGNGEAYNASYNTEVGYLASTTGNISGVYDMSGGSHEYTASRISNKLGSSGFKAATIAEYDEKYFDLYNASSTTATYKYRILGDATGEMGPFKSFLDGDNTSRYHNSWYNDTGSFVSSTEPWFFRGAVYNAGVLAGQFQFNSTTGEAQPHHSFRLVLMP